MDKGNKKLINSICYNEATLHRRGIDSTDRSPRPWIFAGDESGAQTFTDEGRFACYAMVGIPALTYKTFERSMPQAGGKFYEEADFLKIFPLFRKCFGQAAIGYIDFGHPQILRLKKHIEQKREMSTLPEPVKAAHFLWLYGLGDALLELISAVTKTKNPIGDLHITYHDKTMPDRLRSLLRSYIPKMINEEIVKNFRGLENYYPLARPMISSFEVGKTNEPLTKVADLFARMAFRSLKSGQMEFVAARPEIVINDCTERILKRANTK